MSVASLDEVLTLLSAASTAPPGMRTIYAAEARMRLAAVRDRFCQCERALDAIEAEIERVAQVSSQERPKQFLPGCKLP